MYIIVALSILLFNVRIMLYLTNSVFFKRETFICRRCQQTISWKKMRRTFLGYRKFHILQITGMKVFNSAGYLGTVTRFRELKKEKKGF